MNRDEGQLERLLSELADGGVPPEEQARLRAALAADESLRRLAGAYSRLGEFLQVWRALPADVGGREFTAAVHARIAERLEFTLSQYVDETLSDEEARRVAVRFTGDPTAVRVERELRRTQELLEAWARPLPEVDHAALGARIREAVRREAARKRGSSRSRLYAGLAMAAALTLAVAVGWKMLASGAGKSVGAVPVAAVRIDQPAAGGQVVVAVDEKPPPGLKNKPLAPASRSHGLAIGKPTRSADDQPPGF